MNPTDRSATPLVDAFHEVYYKAVFARENGAPNLLSVPRPFRELAAAHQAWGAIGSDGFASFFELGDEDLEREAQRGLTALGYGRSSMALTQAREAARQGALESELEERLWNEFYSPITKLEADLEQRLKQVLVTDLEQSGT